VELTRLTIKDKPLFNKFLNLKRHELSVYSFEIIYIWRKIYDIRWALVKDSLCVFFQDKIACFLYLAPLAKQLKPGVLAEVFRHISRIENIEEEEIGLYRRLGYECVPKFGDYLCRRADLVNLQGNKFKSKRAAFNYFTKHYKFAYLPFSIKHKKEYLSLYDHWMRLRCANNPDKVYQGMMQDSRTCLQVLLDDYKHLKITGRVIEIEKRIKAFTFGFKLNADTFCILYEITDLAVKGLSQFIFREFCRELKTYKYINIMDDSGLENLKKVKLSYQPVRLISSYIAKRRL
jgi:hypothetical protein